MSLEPFLFRCSFRSGGTGGVKERSGTGGQANPKKKKKKKERKDGEQGAKERRKVAPGFPDPRAT